MVEALGWLLRIILVGWAAAEAGLQLRQLLRSGRTERTEWRSLAVLVVTAVVGVRSADAVRHAAPGLDYGVRHAALLAAVLLVACAGIALRLWAIVTLGRFFRGTVHVQQGHQVVSTGPYRVLRHPSYSGVLVAVAALGGLEGNVLSWAVLTACVTLGLVYRIRVEERFLRAALGEAYQQYAARTRRLVPGLW